MFFSSNCVYAYWMFTNQGIWKCVSEIFEIYLFHVNIHISLAHLTFKIWKSICMRTNCAGCTLQSSERCAFLSCRFYPNFSYIASYYCWHYFQLWFVLPEAPDKRFKVLYFYCFIHTMNISLRDIKGFKSPREFLDRMGAEAGISLL